MFQKKAEYFLYKFNVIDNIAFLTLCGFLQSFEIWMHKWLLFQMAQNKQPEEIAAVKGILDL